MEGKSVGREEGAADGLTLSVTKEVGCDVMVGIFEGEGLKEGRGLKEGERLKA